MPKNNPYYIKTEIKKPVETVYELKGNEYKVPSFEEFMKDYKADERINYDNLSGGSVGKQTGISTPLGEIKVYTKDCVIQ